MLDSVRLLSVPKLLSYIGEAVTTVMLCNALTNELLAIKSKHDLCLVSGGFYGADEPGDQDGDMFGYHALTNAPELADVLNRAFWDSSGGAIDLTDLIDAAEFRRVCIYANVRMMHVDAAAALMHAKDHCLRVAAPSTLYVQEEHRQKMREHPIPFYPSAIARKVPRKEWTNPEVKKALDLEWEKKASHP